MLTNLTKHALRNLSSYRDYKIINKHEVTTTVTHPIPHSTGYVTYGRNPKSILPDYLKGFEQYYDAGRYSMRIKPEYRYNRPKYTIEVKHTLYDVELTKLGMEYVQERISHYQRLAQGFARFLED
jgi:hypothetical protein